MPMQYPYLNEKARDDMKEHLDELQTELDYLDDEVARPARRCLRRVFSDHEGLELDEEDDRQELIDLIPNNLSLGENQSLREAINVWRHDYGYGRK